MALRLKDNISRKPEDESEERPSLPTIPVAALEAKRHDPAVRERRERVRARMNAKKGYS